MSLRDHLRGIWAIVEKDMRTYYLKPPAVSWGVVFPVAWILAFYLRNPGDFVGLLPGLVTMTALFSSTAAEAVVINFELRLGSLERLLLAPIGPGTVFLAKVLGGAFFGLLMSGTVLLFTITTMPVSANARVFPVLFLSLLAFASLGAMLCILVREVFEAQTLLNLPRFVMVFLSGVVYPISAMPTPLRVLARFFPLTYSVEGLQAGLSLSQPNTYSLDLLALSGFTVAFLLIGMRRFSARFK